jgi:AraC-like DNA-binding protein
MSIIVKPEHGEEVLSSFAKIIGSQVDYGRVVIPDKFGSGYVMGFLFGKSLRMFIRNYVMLDEVVITRDPDLLAKNDMVLISLNHILKPAFKVAGEPREGRARLPSVTITTNGFKPVLHLSADQCFHDILLGVDPAYLSELLDTKTDHPILKNIIANDQPLLFEQVVSLSLQKTAEEIVDSIISPPFHHFFYKLKAEELICYLLMELSQRKEHNVQALNANDIERLFAVKCRIETTLSEVPVLSDLAAFAGLSESKLTRLFKQVFGSSIYTYYQSVRMNEAAYLLKHKHMSVSAVGYALGFTNLSHFTRMFEHHIGIKPKKYSMSAG